MIKFRQIEAFRSVMLHGSMSAAANQMHVSQPAISRLIADLEHGLGFALFERRNGRLHPSSEGIEMFSAVEESFLGMEKLESIAEQLRNQDARELRIVSTPSLASSLLPLAIKEYARYHPDERIMVSTDSLSQVVVRLQTNNADLALGLALDNLMGVDSESIGTARYVLAVHEDHALAQKDVVCVHDLIGESVLEVLAVKPAHWHQIDDVLAPIKGQYHRQLGFDVAYTGYAMIAAGLAVGIMEPFQAAVWQSQGVVTRPFEPQLHFSYHLAFPTGCRRHRSVHSFAEVVKKVAATMPGFTHV